VRAAQIIDAEPADTRLDQPLKRAVNMVGAPQRPFLAADVAGHEIVEHIRDGLGCRGRRSILDRVLATIDTLPQIARLADGLERRPIWPRADGVAVLATADAV